VGTGQTFYGPVRAAAASASEHWYSVIRTEREEHGVVTRETRWPWAMQRSLQTHRHHRHHRHGTSQIIGMAQLVQENVSGVRLNAVGVRGKTLPRPDSRGILGSFWDPFGISAFCPFCSTEYGVRSSGCGVASTYCTLNLCSVRRRSIPPLGLVCFVFQFLLLHRVPFAIDR
jgi:hypothetical protein